MVTVPPIKLKGVCPVSYTHLDVYKRQALRIANVSKYCIIVISTGPVVILYAFLQKYFEKGVMIGSLCTQDL